MRYIVITGDIIASRAPSNQEYLAKLPENLKMLTEQHNPLLPYIQSAGDEIQTVFKASVNPFSIALDILATLFPLSIRIGIGRGNISTGIMQSVNEMRGQAFELARHALQSAKSRQAYFSYQDGTAAGNLLESYAMLLSALITKWNQKTFLRFSLYSRYHSIYKVSRQEQVSPEAINKYLRHYKIREILSSAELITTYLKSTQ